jgi:hypothetical protein
MNLRELSVSLVLCLGVTITVDVGSAEPQVPATDNRQFVEMPEEAQQLMRKDMRDHLMALSEILGYLANNNYSSAAEVAEQRLGESSMGKHRATGMGPGRFMPPSMRQIGQGMHKAATRFADVANSSDMDKRNSALQEVVALCAACHASYRIR